MKEYKDKTLPDLHKLIAEKQEAIRHFRFGSTGSKTKNVKLGKTLKKDVARIMTELTFRAKGMATKGVKIASPSIKGKIKTK